MRAVAQIMLGLQDQDLELGHWIKERSATLATVTIAQPFNEPVPEALEIPVCSRTSSGSLCPRSISRESFQAEERMRFSQSRRPDPSHRHRLQIIKSTINLLSAAGIERPIGEAGYDSYSPATPSINTRAQVSQFLQGRASSCTTLLRRPTCSISTSTTSPCFMKSGGSRLAPTPPQVPVTITSPGARGTIVEQ